MKDYQSINIVQNIAAGAPTIVGRRLNIYDIISSIELEEDISDYMEGYELSFYQVRDAINYCRSLQCIHDKPYNYCAGCILRSTSINTEIIPFPKQIIVEENYLMFVYDNSDIRKSITEVDTEEIGRAGWGIARKFPKDMLRKI